MTPRKVIISLGIGGWYPQGVQRLCETLKRVEFDGDFVPFYDWPSGCPSQAEVPFAFKPWLMRSMADSGYEQILWLDSSHWAHRRIDPIFDYISREGHWMIEDTSWNCGQWCTDAALSPLGITREEAFGIPMTWAGAIGVDMRNERSRKWLSEWHRLAMDGVSFHGSKWAGPSVSSDPRVLGHRHDQTVQAVLCHRFKMPLVPLHACFLQVDSQTDRDDVCLLARGGIQGTHW